MPTVSTTIDIAAPPHAVWAVLTDWDRFPEWNPFMTNLSGQQKVGVSPTATIKPPDNSAGMTFSPTILPLSPNQHLHWRGRLFGIPGLLTGNHHFVLRRTEDETRFEHYEEFAGVLAWVLRWVGDVYGTTRRGFEGMNAALKDRVEEQGRVGLGEWGREEEDGGGGRWRGRLRGGEG